MLEIKDLQVKDSTGELILNLTLSIDTGGIFALAGVGASGKSIFMRAIADLLPDDLLVSNQKMTFPKSVHYMPQYEHKHVRHPSNLELNEANFISKCKHVRGKSALIMVDEPAPSDEWFHFFSEQKLLTNHLVFLSTHNQDLIARCSSHVILLKEGKLYRILKTLAFFKSRDDYIMNLIKMGF